MQSVLRDWTPCEHLIQDCDKNGLVVDTWYKIRVRWDYVSTVGADDFVRLDWWCTLDTILWGDGIGGGQIVQDWGENGLSVRGSVKVMLKWNRDKAYKYKIRIFAPLQKTHLSVNSRALALTPDNSC